MTDDKSENDPAPAAPSGITLQSVAAGVEMLMTVINRTETSMVIHKFQLRRELVVAFWLPLELTKTDARRLYSYIHALPFHDEEEETTR